LDGSRVSPILAAGDVEAKAVEVVVLSAAAVAWFAVAAADVIVTSGARVTPGVDGPLVPGSVGVTKFTVGVGATDVAVGCCAVPPSGECPQICSKVALAGGDAELTDPLPHLHAWRSPSFDRVSWYPVAE
jgi:hypothetical protein